LAHFKPKGKPTIKAMYAFDEYCALGYDRSLRKLATIFMERRIQKEEDEAIAQGTPIPRFTDDDRRKMHNSLLKQFTVWSSSFGWQEKVRDYDIEVFERKKKKREAEIDKMNENHATLASGMVIRAVKQIQELIEDKKLGGTAAVALFKEASNLERVARGAASEIVQSETRITGELAGTNSLTIDLSKLTIEQLSTLETIAKQIEQQ